MGQWLASPLQQQQHENIGIYRNRKLLFGKMCWAESESSFYNVAGNYIML